MAAGAAGEHRPEAGSPLRRRDRAHREVGLHLARPRPDGRGPAASGWVAGGVELRPCRRPERRWPSGRRSCSARCAGRFSERPETADGALPHVSTEPRPWVPRSWGRAVDPRVIRLLGVGLNPSRRVMGQVTLVVAAAGRLAQSLVMGEPQFDDGESPGEEDGRSHGKDLELSRADDCDQQPGAAGVNLPHSSIVPSDLGIWIWISPIKTAAHHLW